jgi:hypothetical protein
MANHNRGIVNPNRNRGIVNKPWDSKPWDSKYFWARYYFPGPEYFSYRGIVNVNRGIASNAWDSKYYLLVVAIAFLTAASM